MSRHRPLVLLLVMPPSVLLLASLLCGCAERLVLSTTDATDPNAPEMSRWTVAVYMSADNELDEQALVDLNEMEAAARANAEVTVVVLIDRAVAADSSSSSQWGGTRVYELRRDPRGGAPEIVSERLSSERLGIDAEQESELNTGSARTLGAFLDFTAEHYPAEHTALIVWGLGSGYKAVSVDDGSGGDPLHTAELGRALAGRDIDAVGLDVLFGAQLEIAYELHACARTLVASQQSIGLDGWDYRSLLEQLAARSAEPHAFEQAAMEAYQAAYAAAPGACISVVDLPGIPAVRRALDELCEVLNTEIADHAVREELRRLLFEDVEGFFRRPGDLNLDLDDLAARVAAAYPATTEEAESLRRVLEETVRDSWVAEGANGRAAGLSVHYIPVDSAGYAHPPHEDDYFAGRVVGEPLRFVGDSSWPPRENGGGFLYRLWYEAM
ncbi:MAG: clostripain-related cysteine peptidase [Spirochaetaceae bacterium]